MIFPSLIIKLLFLAFSHAKVFFSYHILMNILIYIKFLTKKSLDNPYRKTLQNKKMTCFNRCLFNKVLLYILYYKDMVKRYYIKIVQRIKKNIRSQMVYKVVALESFAKFTGKHQCWNHILIKSQA